MQLCVHAALTLLMLSLVPIRRRLSISVKSALLMACFLGLGVAGVVTAMVGAGYWGFLQSAVLVGPCARKA
ncbi:MAG: hypothetical protein ABJB17_01510 [Burkholderiales bacterium]